MNRVDLIGNLTRDVELQTAGKGGVSVAKFSLAVNRNYKNEAGEYETDFFQIVAWRGLGENCAKFLQKGDKVGVCGEIRTGSYENKDGEKKYTTEIIASDVEFLSPKKGQKEESAVAEEEPETKKGKK
jgi:single-strand DNA-binding protein